MNPRVKLVLMTAVLAAAAAVVFFFIPKDVATIELEGPADEPAAVEAAEEAPKAVEAPKAAAEEAKGAVEAVEPAEGDDAEEPEDGEPISENEPEDPETVAAREAVEAFDAFVEDWRDEREGGVTEEDIDAFKAAFARVHKENREEEIHVALNLLPDEHVMLLAGILLDTTEDPEILDLIMSDILNRSDEVKMPIIREVFKDKSHPSWETASFILSAQTDDGEPAEETAE